MSVFSDIMKLTRQLYPKGRAFNLLPNSLREKLHKGLATVEASSYEDALSVINQSLLPDNDDFDLDDAQIWEERLAIPVSTGASLADRKAAILRKWRYPGTAKARAHRLFLQGQLQEAGFDVYVYENRIDDGSGGITTINPFGFIGWQHGEFEHGEYEHGEFGAEAIINYIDPSRDASYDFAGNYQTSFFIASADFGSVDSLGVVTPDYTAPASSIVANIDADRRLEIRELILRLKPAKTKAFLLVNWV